jgi:CHASE1-domain containing sensor protein
MSPPHVRRRAQGSDSTPKHDATVTTVRKIHDAIERAQESRVTIFAFMFMAVVLAATLGWYKFNLSTNDEARLDGMAFEFRARTALNAIATNWNASMLYLQLGLVNFHIVRNCNTTRSEFEQLTNAGRYWSSAVIAAAEFVPKVVGEAERAYWEAEGKMLKSDYVFTTRNGTGALLPDPVHPVYFPVQFVMPLNDNIAAFGFDLYTNPERAAAIDSAGKTGQLTVSARLRLVQDASQYGVLVFAPFYKTPTGCSHNVNASGAQFIGLFLLVIKLESFLSESVGHLGLTDVDVYVFDKATDGTYRYLAFVSGPMEHCKETPKPTLTVAALITPQTILSASQSAPDIQAMYDIPVGSRVWTLFAVTRPHYLSARASSTPVALLVVSLLTSVSSYTLLGCIKGLKMFLISIERKREASAALNLHTTDPPSAEVICNLATSSC